VILVAAALYPCIGCFLPPKTANGKPCIENLAPSKQKGARIEAIIKECLDSDGPNFSDGFAISQTSLEKFIPQAIEDWLARQDRVLLKTGDGDCESDEVQLDNIMEHLIEAYAQQRLKNDEYKAANDETRLRMDHLANLAEEVRVNGVAGMSAENRGPGPRASATSRAQSTRGSEGGHAELSDDEAGSEELDAAQLYSGGGGGAVGGKESGSIDKLVAVLASNADTAREAAAAQRAFDSRRLDNEDKRVEIESEKEKRLGRQLDSETDRDERRDNAKIEADKLAADRAEASAKASRDMMQEMMKFMQRDRR